MRDELVMVEFDAHRHALHDLDPVAAGVLRRQQRKRPAGAGTEADDLAAVLDAAAPDIGRQRHRLADAQARELAFFLKFASTHSRSSGTSASSGVPAATRAPTCTTRARPGRRPARRSRVRGERERRLLDLGGGALHVRVRVDCGVLDQHLGRRELVADVGEARLGAAGSAVRACPSSVEIAPLPESFWRRARTSLRLREIGLAVWANRRAQARRGSRNSWRDVAHGAGQIGLGGIERDARIGRLIDQRRAGDDHRCQSARTASYRCRDARRHRDHVAGDVGVMVVP